MRWAGRRQSGNVEDRRGMSGRRGIGGRLGVVVVIVIAVLFGADPQQLLNLVPATQQESGAPPTDAAQEELKQCVSVVLADTEDIWGDLFTRQGASYVKPWVVLFTDRVESACGYASAASGPFYCPPDQKVWTSPSSTSSSRASAPPEISPSPTSSPTRSDITF